MNEDRYYADISRVKEVVGDTVACEHILGGWELLTIKEIAKTELQDDKPVVNSHVVYVLGLRHVEEPRPIEEGKTEPNLTGLGWKPAPFDSTGRVFSVPPDGVPEDVRRYFKTHNMRFEDEKNTYKLSTSGWLNKYPKEVS